MANDYAGLVTSISQTLTDMADPKMLYNREADGALIRAAIALFKAKCVANGVILP